MNPILLLTLRSVVGQPDEMEHKRIDDLERQGVLLVEQDSDEEGCWTGVVGELGEVGEGGSGVDHGD